MLAQEKSPEINVTPMHNRKWQYGRQNRKHIYLSQEIWQIASRIQIYQAMEDLCFLTTTSCRGPTRARANTGNGNMTANIGNSYNPITATARIEIPMANLRYSVMASSINNVCWGNCHNDRRVENAKRRACVLWILSYRFHIHCCVVVYYSCV